MISKRSRSRLLGFGIEILNLQELQFAIHRHLADVHLLSIFDVGRAFARIREYDSLRLHPVLHHLPDLLLFCETLRTLMLSLHFFRATC